ncbi:MAG TPA: hypothetical protein VMR14_21460 [Streptosporangiaceae bacterium]|nr:hypothetical protein [Streptosporangiaceae bacterium]
MWGAQRRGQQLEGQVAMAIIDQAALTRPATASGPLIAPAERVPTAPMPRQLVAAAREPRDEEFAVRLDLAGARVVAVIRGEGDPREWWTAIWLMAGSGSGSGSGVSGPPAPGVRLQALPAGLSAVAIRPPSGDLTLAVSEVIEPDWQRAAVRAALDAERRRARVPVAGAAGLAAAAARLRELLSAVPVRAAVALAAAIILAVSVAAVVALTRPHQGPVVGLSGAGPAPVPAQHHAGGRSSHPASDPTVRALAPPSATSAKSHRATPKPSGRPTRKSSPAPSPRPSHSASSRPSPSPRPSSTPSSPPPTSPNPTPSPSPTPTPSQSGTCVTVLGVRICL